MQDFIRTVDATESFKFKVTMLQEELKRMQEDLNAKKLLLSDKESDYRGLEFGGILNSGRITFNKTMATICFIGSGIFILAFILGTLSKAADYSILAVVSIVSLFVGYVFKTKSKILVEEIEQRKKLINQKKLELQKELHALESEITSIEASIHQQEGLIKSQQNLYHQHMLNQQDLIEKEVEAINHASTPDMVNDTKECPQCAETIKFKAKICRFCGYKFED